jgi:hypothetical protein
MSRALHLGYGPTHDFPASSTFPVGDRPSVGVQKLILSDGSAA